MANELAVVDFDLTKNLAAMYQVPPSELVKAVKAHCFPSGAASDAQLIMFLTACRERGLNPFMKEVYAFTQGGRLQIGVEVDGWIRKANEHPQFDGCKFHDEYANGKIFSVTCQIFRKDRKHPGEYTALFSEWNMPSSQVWKDKPRHMLAVKAFNQCARFTLGLTGITDDAPSAIAAAASNGELREEAVKKAEIVDEQTGEVVNAPAPPAEVRTEEAAQITSAGDERGADQPASPKTEEPKMEEAAKPKGRPKSARTRLKEMAGAMPAARVTVALGQAGVTKLDDVSEEQAAKILERWEKRGNK